MKKYEFDAMVCKRDNMDATFIEFPYDVEKLSYTHKKEYVRWIESAKKEETRASRIEKAMEMLKQGNKMK
jgi:uncharacterized protein YdeI (YjbR/CyaY-like superfamily)